MKGLSWVHLSLRKKTIMENSAIWTEGPPSTSRMQGKHLQPHPVQSSSSNVKARRPWAPQTSLQIPSHLCLLWLLQTEVKRTGGCRWMKCLPCKHKGLNLIPQDLKSWTNQHAPGTPALGGRVQREQGPRACWPASQTSKLQVQHETTS